MTSKSVWTALSIAICVLWLAAAAVGVLLIIYHGRHPESVHAFFTSCLLLVFFGSPVLTLLSTGVIAAARSRGEHIPLMATRSRNAAWMMLSVIVIYLIVILALVLSHT